MVAKKAAGVAGTFAGGILNNPGALAAIGIVVSIVTTLVIFRNDIRNFFGTTIPEAIGGIGQIQLPTIELPDITFPTFEFPSFEFPSFELPTFELPTFEFPTFELPSFPTFEFPMFPSFEDIFGEPGVPTEPTEPTFFGDVGMAGARARQEEAGLTPAEIFAIEERGAPDPSLFALTTFGGGAVRVEQEQVLAEPEPEIPFAVSIVPETQEEFQERAGAFAEAFPELLGATSLSEEIVFGRQLSREQEDFESVLEAEARRSEAIFAGLFGNVQNPEFGA